MIQLTGNETKNDLWLILDNAGIKYSKLDNKTDLLKKIEDYNIRQSSANLQDQSLVKGKVFINKDFDVEKNAESVGITGDQYCNIFGHNKRTHYFINKKYGQDIYSIEEWNQIFQQEKLIE